MKKLYRFRCQNCKTNNVYNIEATKFFYGSCTGCGKAYLLRPKGEKNEQDTSKAKAS